jgi:hypothetical protein
VAEGFGYGIESVEDDFRCLRIREAEASAQLVWEWDVLLNGEVGSENRRRAWSGSEGEGAVAGRPLDLRFFL